MSDAEREHRAAWEAIPWVANGRAGAAERHLVDAHLPHCEDCRDELARQRALLDAIVQLPAPEGDADAGLRRLLERIDAEDDAPPARSARAAASPALVRWLAAAVVVEAVALAAFAVAPFVRPAYTTLADPGAPGRAATIRIVPAPGLRLDELRPLLDAHDLEIVGGPNSAGAYDLAPRSARPDRAAALAALRAAPGLRLAEPVDGPTGARP